MKLHVAAIGASFAMLLAGPALAEMPLPSLNGQAAITLVADGCGYDRYRGPGGYCHRFGFGPYPGGYWGVYNGGGWNGCPPGYWHGPWGHCRNTPYHGRLPGGGWQ